MSTNANAPRQGRKRWPIVVAILALVAVIGGAVFFSSLNGNKLPWESSARAATPTECVVQYLTSDAQQWVEGEHFTTDLTVSDGDAIFTAGSDAFHTDGPVFSSEQLEQYLADDDARAQLASQEVQNRLAGKDVQWVGIKFLVPIQIEGNLGTNGSEIINYGTTSSEVGDVIFFPVDENCQVVEGVIIRAGCGNPATRIIPPCEGGCKPVCPWNPALPPEHPDCEQPKNPEDDVIEDGWEPAPITGPADPTPTPAPSIPLDPEVPPGSPTGPEVPIVDSTPVPADEPEPEPEPEYSAPPAAPHTPIPEPPD